MCLCACGCTNQTDRKAEPSRLGQRVSQGGLITRDPLLVYHALSLSGAAAAAAGAFKALEKQPALAATPSLDFQGRLRIVGGWHLPFLRPGAHQLSTHSGWNG